VTYDDVPQMPKLLAKFQEFNQAVSSDVMVGPAEAALLDQLTRVLSETSYYHSSSVTGAQLQALLRPLMTWSPEYLFPLYDVLRVAVTHPGAAETLAGAMRVQLLQVVQRTVTLLGNASTHASTVLTATRFVCNCVKAEPLRLVVYAETTLASILQAVQTTLVSNSNKLVRAAASRILLNASGFATGATVFARVSLSASAAASLAQGIATLLESEQESVEVLVNAVSALGTLAVSTRGDAVADRSAWRGRLQAVQRTWDASKLQAAGDCIEATLKLF
jgi:phospholipase A-2-activating protein